MGDYKNDDSHGVCDSCFEKIMGRPPKKAVQKGPNLIRCAWCNKIMYDPKQDKKDNQPPKTNPFFIPVVKLTPRQSKELKLALRAWL